MATTAFATDAVPAPSSPHYQPGVCNIGPAEIARRRRAGHVGTLATVGLLALLIGIGAPPLSRLLAILPATIGASGYLQAALKFCAGFGSRGIFNFGPLGDAMDVSDPEARARDRQRSRQIGFGSLGIAVVIGVLAVLLPL
jgi:hypothetical protein